MQRRKFIIASGAATAAGLAGCIGDDGGGSGGPEGVVEDFYDAAENNQDDPEAFVDEAKGLLHSESPLRGFLEFFLQGQDSENAESSTTIPESIETEVVSEDLSADEIQSEFGDSMMMSEVSDDVIDSIAGENAIVETTSEFEDGSTQTSRWLVTKEDGEWVIFLTA
jgi:hypothetical protein